MDILFNETNIKNFHFDAKHCPDKQWLLNLLKTLKPEHKIFKKP